MRIISIANQKGGCGKTTTAINLSACLASTGRGVLLIDMDPQGHSGIGLNFQPKPHEKTIFDVISNPDPADEPLHNAIVEISENLHLAPSGISLSILEQSLSGIQGRETRLKRAIEGMGLYYDYLIIDCPPSLGLLTFNALIASTEVVVPIEMGLFSLHGISRLYEIISMVRERTGHELRVKLLATLYDKRTRISGEVLQNIKEHFKESVFQTVIHTNVKLKEASGFGKSIVAYDPKSRGFMDYSSLLNEVIAEEKILGACPLKHKKASAFAAKTEKRFLLHAPHANAVKIVGTFNNWVVTDEAMMERMADGTWSKSLSLKPGTYQYRFVVDDKWVEDKNSEEFVVNSFGGRNSVLKVG